MTEIAPPDSHHLAAAVGWLELGNASEAGEEIARISPGLLQHPDVLEVRWQICAAGKKWDTALEIADLLVQIDPDRATGWLHRAYALRRNKPGGLKEAWEALLPVQQKFPKIAVIPYNLACYAAQMNRLEEAWEWLHKAMEAGGDVQKIKEMAIDDPDLEALRERIQEL